MKQAGLCWFRINHFSDPMHFYAICVKKSFRNRNYRVGGGTYFLTSDIIKVMRDGQRFWKKLTPIQLIVKEPPNSQGTFKVSESFHNSMLAMLDKFEPITDSSYARPWNFVMGWQKDKIADIAVACDHTSEGCADRMSVPTEYIAKAMLHVVMLGFNPFGFAKIGNYAFKDTGTQDSTIWQLAKKSRNQEVFLINYTHKYTIEVQSCFVEGLPDDMGAIRKYEFRNYTVAVVKNPPRKEPKQERGFDAEDEQDDTKNGSNPKSREETLLPESAELETSPVPPPEPPAPHEEQARLQQGQMVYYSQPQMGGTSFIHTDNIEETIIPQPSSTTLTKEMLEEAAKLLREEREK